MFIIKTSIILGIVAILIVGWFYWFQWRPSEIIKECSTAREEYIEYTVKGSGVSFNNAISMIDLRYERCLGRKGLK